MLSFQFDFGQLRKQNFFQGPSFFLLLAPVVSLEIIKYSFSFKKKNLPLFTSSKMIMFDAFSQIRHWKKAGFS